MHHSTDRIAHTTAFVTQVVEHWLEREIAQWVHPMKDRSDDPSHHERMLLPRCYIKHKTNLQTRNTTHLFSVTVADAEIVELEHEGGHSTDLCEQFQRPGESRGPGEEKYMFGILKHKH